IHLLSPFRKFVCEVHSCECDVPNCEVLSRASRGVDGRLSSKRQCRHIGMAEFSPVPIYQSGIACEYDIAEFRQRKEVVKMWWILLIPKDDTNTASSAG